MPRTRAFDRFFRSLTRKQRFIYWQTVPLRRLLPLLFGIFCLFGMIGFIIDLFSLGQKPLTTVLIWTLFTGVMAVGYVLVVIRAPEWLFVPVALHVLGSWLVRLTLHHLAIEQSHPTTANGVRIAAFWILALSVLAALFFFAFLQGEGRQSVRLQTELALAHHIQQTLVPTINERLKGCEIYGDSLPSDHVGGDLVDCVVFSDGSLLAYLADIAGHGLPAGVLMGMLKTSVRTQSSLLPTPASLFETLNDVLPSVKEPNMYAACTALRISFDQDGRSEALEYAIAGQHPVLHISAKTLVVNALADEQFPLGLFPNVTYLNKTVEVQGGDLFIVATDGILEAENASGELFGLERVGALAVKHFHAPLVDIAGHLRAAVHREFHSDDDQTLLLIRLANE